MSSSTILTGYPGSSLEISSSGYIFGYDGYSSDYYDGSDDYDSYDGYDSGYGYIKEDPLPMKCKVCDADPTCRKCFRYDFLPVQCGQYAAAKDAFHTKSVEKYFYMGVPQLGKSMDKSLIVGRNFNVVRRPCRTIPRPYGNREFETDTYGSGYYYDGSFYDMDDSSYGSSDYYESSDYNGSPDNNGPSDPTGSARYYGSSKYLGFEENAYDVPKYYAVYKNPQRTKKLPFIQKSSRKTTDERMSRLSSKSTDEDYLRDDAKSSSESKQQRPSKHLPIMPKPNRKTTDERMSRASTKSTDYMRDDDKISSESKKRRPKNPPIKQKSSRKAADEKASKSRDQLDYLRDVAKSLSEIKHMMSLQNLICKCGVDGKEESSARSIVCTDDDLSKVNFAHDTQTEDQAMMTLSICSKEVISMINPRNSRMIVTKCKNRSTCKCINSNQSLELKYSDVVTSKGNNVHKCICTKSGQSVESKSSSSVAAKGQKDSKSVKSEQSVEAKNSGKSNRKNTSKASDVSKSNDNLNGPRVKICQRDTCDYCKCREKPKISPLCICNKPSNIVKPRSVYELAVVSKQTSVAQTEMTDFTQTVSQTNSLWYKNTIEVKQNNIEMKSKSTVTKVETTSVAVKAVPCATNATTVCSQCKGINLISHQDFGAQFACEGCEQKSKKLLVKPNVKSTGIQGCAIPKVTISGDKILLSKDMFLKNMLNFATDKNCNGDQGVLAMANIQDGEDEKTLHANRNQFRQTIVREDKSIAISEDRCSRQKLISTKISKSTSVNGIRTRNGENQTCIILKERGDKFAQCSTSLSCTFIKPKEDYCGTVYRGVSFNCLKPQEDYWARYRDPEVVSVIVFGILLMIQGIFKIVLG